MNFKFIASLCLLSNTLCSPVTADQVSGVDSGGGKSSIGTSANHGSIGGSFATSVVSTGTSVIRSGLVEVLYADAAPYDANENGIADAWEEEHFGDDIVDPLADADGDGDSNLMEFLAGTNPKDATSNFKPKGDNDGTIHEIPIQTIEGRTYEVYVSKDLKNWYLDETYTGDGSQKIFSFDETTVPAGPLHSETHPSSYFFKIKIIKL